MIETTRAAVAAAIARGFGAGSVAGIQRLLDAYPAAGTSVPDSERARIHLAILQLAKGDVARVRHFVQQAIADYRDVLYWVELEDHERRGRPD